MNVKIISILTLFLFLLTACYYNVGNEPKPIEVKKVLDDKIIVDCYAKDLDIVGCHQIYEFDIEGIYYDLPVEVIESCENDGFTIIYCIGDYHNFRK